MYSLSTLVVFSVLALVIGALLGALALRRFGGQTELETRLQKAEQQFKDYQADVTEHFAETSRRVNTLTQNYKDVHEYLASSAMKLTNPQMSRAISQAAQQHLPDAASRADDEEALDAIDDARQRKDEADVTA